MGVTGWGSVEANFTGLRRLGFSSGKICTYIVMGSYFDESQKESIVRSSCIHHQ